MGKKDEESEVILPDFNTHGIKIVKESKGGGYLEESIYIFIPLYTEDPEESP